MLEKMKAPTSSRQKIGGRILRLFTAKRPRMSTLGSSFLCLVFSIRGLNSTSRPGIRVKTASRLKKMDFISTRDISRPMRNCIKARAPRPLRVVREEALTSGMALARAAVAARTGSRVSRSAVKRWHRMTA